MVDDDGPEIARDFYGEFFSDEENVDSSRAAYCLHKAVKRLRASGVSPARWATFIHVGV